MKPELRERPEGPWLHRYRRSHRQDWIIALVCGLVTALVLTALQLEKLRHPIERPPIERSW